MGVRWGIAGTPENLLFMKSKLPSTALWSVLGIQKSQLPMITMGMLLGGHIRVGFEDNIYLKKGVLLSSNAQMVEIAVDLADGYSVAKPLKNERRSQIHSKNATSRVHDMNFARQQPFPFRYTILLSIRLRLNSERRARQP